MSFFANLFGTEESAKFWRNRAESLEKELKIERIENRERERTLLDKVLALAKLNPISEPAKRAAARTLSDENGFEHTR